MLPSRVRNEVVRKILNLGELNGKLRETRPGWFGHVARSDNDYVGQRTRCDGGRSKRGGGGRGGDGRTA